MSFRLLTKSCWLPVVQSTTTGITTCALWHCFHTVPHSLAVVPIRKLLQYSHFQNHGDALRHLVGSSPQHYPYRIILRKYSHITHDSSLAGMSSQSCSTVLYSLHSVLQFSTLLSRTSRPSRHKCCTSTHDSGTVQILTLHTLH